MTAVREAVKEALTALGVVDRRRPSGATLLIYHRIGGGTGDELDLPVAQLMAQLDVLAGDGHDVVSLDTALDRLDRGDPTPSVVLTFDDGFASVYEHAWPVLRDRQFPFTVYVTSGCVDGSMRWEGSTATAPGPALSWAQLGELAASGLCTLGNHTRTHPRPEALTVEEIDACSEELDRRVGVRPRHFAYTWGIPVPSVEPDLRARFRSAATGTLGRNLPGTDAMALRRVPVRQSDPMAFFRAKLAGNLWPERAYDVLVRTAKRVGARG